MGSSPALPTCRFQESEQVSKLLQGELLFETLWHDRQFAGTSIRDFGTSEADFGAGTSAEDEFVWGVFFEDAAVLLAIFRFDDDGLVAPDEAGAGEKNGFEEVAFGADLTDSGQVRSEIATEVTNGVATRAGGGLGVEDGLTAAHIAVR